MTRTSRKLAALFLAAIVPASMTLVWLGWWSLQQDRAVWAQSEVERRAAAAEAAVRYLDDHLRDVIDAANANGRVMRFDVQRGGIQPVDRPIPWLPVLTGLAEENPAAFAEAELLEFRGQAERALTLYEQMVQSPSPVVQAGALLRIARVHRARGEWDAAITAYERLRGMDDVAFNGMVVSLVGRRARCAVFEEAVQKLAFAECAATLEKKLLDGLSALRMGRDERWDLILLDVCTC